jgi:hypothetical protein
MNTTLTPP